MASSVKADSISFSAGGGAKDFFQSSASAIGAHPVRSIVTVANIASAVGTLSSQGSNSMNANFSIGTSVVLGAVQTISGFARGIDALASTGYSRTQFGAAPKTQAFSALGDLMSGAGQFALAAGVSLPAAVLLVGGNVVSGLADFNS